MNEMHKRFNNDSPEAAVEVEILRAQMADALQNAEGAIVITLMSDGGTRLLAFGNSDNLFAGALLGVQRLVSEHWKAGGSHDHA